MNTDKRDPWHTQLRTLRVVAGKKQWEVAKAMGLVESSYSNAESAKHKRVSRDVVLKLAAYFELDPVARDLFVADWEAMPASQFSANRSEGAKKRRAQADAARAAQDLKLSLVEVLARLLDVAPDPDELCSCAAPATDAEFGAPPPPCEVCKALQRVGLTGWTSHDDVMAKLAKVQEGLAS